MHNGVYYILVHLCYHIIMVALFRLLYFKRNIIVNYSSLHHFAVLREFLCIFSESISVIIFAIGIFFITLIAIGAFDAICFFNFILLKYKI